MSKPSADYPDPAPAAPLRPTTPSKGPRDEPAKSNAAGPAQPRRTALLARALPLAVLAGMTGCAGSPPLPKTEPAAVQEKPAPAAPVAGEVEPEVRRVFQQAVAMLRQQQYRQAAEALEPVAERHPELSGVLVNLAVAYIHLERQEQATAVLRQALSTDPEHPVALNWLAILERRAGRFEEAKALYQRLLAAHPESRHGHLNLGILCDLYLRQPDCALEHYRRYQELSGDADPEVDQWIADLERRRQQG
ncbi:MAG: tetratricopeptide repeat protein [Xanthomonadaceae bacterium]|nr:tetratricopeptide repeat protein [Xanthomonadaceae bacterium]